MTRNVCGFRRAWRAAACFGLAVASVAYATDYTWQGGDGLFSDGSMWLPTGVPANGDRAKFSTATDATVTWMGDVSNNEMQLVQTSGSRLVLDLGGYMYTLTNRFTFDGTKAGTDVVITNGFLAAPTNTCEMKITAGVAPARLTLGKGLSATLNGFTFYNSELNVTTGAVVTFNGECKVNESQIAPYSALNISGGDVVCNNHFKCPNDGRAGATSVLSIASGSLVAKQYFSIGEKNGPSSVGIVDLSGGTLETWGTVWLGNSGGASGIANISGGRWVSKGHFEVSHREYTTAFMNMSGGEVEMAPSRYFSVAHAGSTTLSSDTGTVAMTGGRIVSTNTGCSFYVGNGSNCFGRCSVGGSGTILARDFYVAAAALSEGECLVTGGLVQVGSTLSVGGANAAVGRLLVSGGAVTNLGTCYIGNGAGSRGSLAVDGGSLMVSNALWLGQNAGAVGDARLSGGELIVANAVTVGNNGVGALSVSNGAMTVMGDCTVGLNGTGRLGVAGGGCSVAGNGMFGKNVKGVGLVAVRGGVLDCAKGIRVGDWGGVCELRLDGGVLVGGAGGGSSIGNGNGSTGLLVQTAGRLEIKNTLYLANNGSGTLGRLEVSGGALAVSNQLVAGNNPFTRGEMTVGGGTVWVGDDIRLGVSSNTFGSLTVSGGAVTNADYIDVGHYGTGVLHVAGGEVVTKVLRLIPYSYTNGAPVAELLVSGGLLHVTNVLYSADALFSTSKVTLAGGTFKLPQLWSNRGTTLVRCDGGELETTRTDANFINSNAQVLELTANGLYVVSTGFDIGTSRNLPDAAGEHGKLGKRGAGKFTLNASATFSGPVVVEGGELALGPSGLITLAGGCEVDGGALLNLSARTLDFTLPAGTVSRVDGELRLASGKTLTVASGATLGGTGVVGRVVLEAGAVLLRSAANGASLLTAAECVVQSGSVLALTGFTAEELRAGIPVLACGAVTLGSGVAVTLEGVPQEHVALSVTGGILRVYSYEPGTLIQMM